MIIGLAGKSCSGKNQVAGILENRGFDSVDLDLMVHDLIISLSSPLKDEFGDKIMDSAGMVDRHALGSLVFADPMSLKKLENILYPALHEKLEQYLKERTSKKPLLVNAAALQKGDFWKRCDIILWVQAPWPQRLYRAWKRDQRSLENIIKRFRAQRELKPQYFFSRVDTYIIRNGLTRPALEKRVDAWLKHLLPEK